MDLLRDRALGQMQGFGGPRDALRVGHREEGTNLLHGEPELHPDILALLMYLLINHRVTEDLVMLKSTGMGVA